MSESLIEQPIGVFDSGVGGISVLGRMATDMPRETFIFLADQANAPYGTKSYDEVLQLTIDAVTKLLDRNVKALVVACNTATSVAINTIRGMTDIPVIGMEPAVKPALQICNGGLVAVMATPLTLKEEKFNNLLRKFDLNTTIISVPCPGLVELIEGEAEPNIIVNYLMEQFKSLPVNKISTVVLGCTHFSFIKKEIYEAVGGNVCIIDGSEGTSRHLKSILETRNLKAVGKSRNMRERIQLCSSSSNAGAVEVLYSFFERALNLY